MKKKFILILSLVALLSCIFVVSASAEFVFYSPDGLPTSSANVYGNYYTHNCSHEHHGFDYFVNGVDTLKTYAVDIDQFKTFVAYYNVINYDSFTTAFGSLYEEVCTIGGCDSTSSAPWYDGLYDMSMMPEDVFNYFLNYIHSIDTTVRDYHSDLNLEFAEYRDLCNSNSEEITVEGFSSYLQENNPLLDSDWDGNLENLLSYFYSAGVSSSTSSGESSGGSSGSSGSDGSPNIPDDELGTFTGDFVGAGANGCTICGGGSDSLGCQHYQNGYAEGYDDALRSDTNKSNFQKAFDQGYYYANSEDFSTTIQNRIEESKDSHIFEYKQSTEFTEYLLSEEFTSSENHSKVIANYCNTQEFVDMLLENQSIGMNNFKASDEYAAILAAERLAGKDDGYQLGLEEGSISGYERGVDDGYAMFRGSDLFNQTLNQWYQNGYHDGVDDSTEDGPSIVGIVSAIIIVCGIFIGAFAISVKLRKRKK